MGARLRLLVMLLGGVLVVLTYTYPLWRPEPTVEVEREVFPGLAEELQAVFVELPPNVQNVYRRLASENQISALERLEAHLSPPGPLPPEEAALPPVENAVIAASGEFRPIELAEDDERELPFYYNTLYRGTSGEVIIYQYPDGTRLLRIEELQVINGPDLWVALSPNPQPVNGTNAELGSGYIEIAPLLTNQGDQNYTAVPDANNVNLNNYASVVIYDRSNQIIFGVAPIN